MTSSFPLRACATAERSARELSANSTSSLSSGSVENAAEVVTLLRYSTFPHFGLASVFATAILMFLVGKPPVYLGCGAEKYRHNFRCIVIGAISSPLSPTPSDMGFYCATPQ